MSLSPRLSVLPEKVSSRVESHSRRRRRGSSSASVRCSYLVIGSVMYSDFCGHSVTKPGRSGDFVGDWMFSPEDRPVNNSLQSPLEDRNHSCLGLVEIGERSQHSPGFVERLLKFSVGPGVRDNTSSGLHFHT